MQEKFCDIKKCKQRFKNVKEKNLKSFHFMGLKLARKHFSNIFKFLFKSKYLFFVENGFKKPLDFIYIEIPENLMSF